MNFNYNSQFIYHSGEALILESNNQKEILSSDTHQLFYLQQGEIQFNFDSKTISINNNCLLLVPAKIKLTYTTTTKSEIFLCQFSAQLYQVLDLFALTQTIDFIEVENPSLTEELFTQLLNYENDTFQHSYILKLIMHPLLSRAHNHENSRNLFRLIPVLDYIEKNIKFSPRIIDLANLINLDKVYFTSLFKRVLGVSPGQYIQQRKIKTACDMLQECLTVSEITEELNFYDTSHFCRIFRKEMNETPKQYLKKANSLS